MSNLAEKSPKQSKLYIYYVGFDSSGSGSLTEVISRVNNSVLNRFNIKSTYSFVATSVGSAGESGL